jgi:hypothetical protein
VSKEERLDLLVGANPPRAVVDVATHLLDLPGLAALSPPIGRIIGALGKQARPFEGCLGDIRRPRLFHDGIRAPFAFANTLPEPELIDDRADRLEPLAHDRGREKDAGFLMNVVTKQGHDADEPVLRDQVRVDLGPRRFQGKDLIATIRRAASVTKDEGRTGSQAERIVPVDPFHECGERSVG